ncbi:GNAT family N-acetyltransferase [Streptomyces sp. NPDC100445]|uniref:GNAT family N-acetyltransferase n=1 Tax=Streptomyces sp. NPDC100445 TaxID=3366102 RepID=UPI0038064DFE
MPPLSLSPLRLAPRDIAEVVGIYASNPEYGRTSGEYDAEHIQAHQVEAEMREDTSTGRFDVLLSRDIEGQAVGLVSLLRQHPGDGYPWIGLLIVHGDHHRKGRGRLLANLVEERLRSEGRNGVRLAVLENNPTALAFWNSLGWHEIDRRPDAQYGRPCTVMHKQLT